MVWSKRAVDIDWLTATDYVFQRFRASRLFRLIDVLAAPPIYFVLDATPLPAILRRCGLIVEQADFGRVSGRRRATIA